MKVKTIWMIFLDIEGNSFYPNIVNFPALFDSGAKSNLISRAIIKILSLQTQKNVEPIKLLTCLDDEFESKENVIVKIGHREMNVE